MRIAAPVMVALVGVALLAGCSGKDAPAPALAPTESPGPSGVTAVGGQAGGNGTGARLPAEFLAGFRVDDVHLGEQGAEPNVGVTSSGAVFATAFETVMRSTDAGLSYAPVYSQKVGFTSDPMLWVDPVTDRIFSPQMFPTLLCSSFIISDDDGESWTEVPAVSCGLPVIDHQKVASGPPPAGSVFTPSPTYPDLVTYCYNKLTATHCAVSIDGGLRFEHDTIIDTSPIAPTVDTQFGCGGLNGHQHHAADGTIYVPYGFNCGQVFVGVSTDGGFSYTRHNLGIPNIGLDPEVTSTPDGTTYLFSKSPEGSAYVIRSKDRFETYEGPFTVSPPEVRTTAFLGMTAGSDGRVAFGYLGTNDPAAIEDHVNATSVWYAYVTMTLDGGSASPTFVTVKASSDPVQRGSICMHDGCEPDDPDDNNSPTNRNLLDFVDLHAGPDGRFFFAYADGCTSKDCLAPGGLPRDSRDSELVVARLAVGPSLQAGKPAFVG
ncbi:MAG TPA: sialidase family protein [Candidatus Thermoplasmatota archaeon]|nr:sialidase family protein [Candidatus Thermoplasmatota archaeon]